MKTSELVSPIRHLNSILKATEFEVHREHLPQNPVSPHVSQWPLPSNPSNTGPNASKGGKGYGGPYSPQTIGLQFDGEAGTGIYPPDTFGAVGPTQILVTTNSRVRVFDKAGTAGPLNVTIDSFFSSVGGLNGTSDPRATFDKVSNRWFVLAINVTSPNRIMLAVSSGPTITGTGSFTFYFVSVPGAFCDYPSMGVDANGIYVGENTFNTALTAFLGCNVTVIQKSSVLSGGPIFSTRFNVATSAGAGPFAPRGVDNDDPAATDGYIIGPDNATFGTLMMRKVFNAGTNAPTISGNLAIPVPSTVFPEDVPASGSTSRLDSLDDRIFHAQMHRNRKTGLRTIYCAHNIEVNASGVASSSGSRDAARWYEVNPATPSLVQSGTSFDSSGAPLYRWIPSCAQTGQGHMALCFNSANSTNFVSGQCAGRLAGDALGSIQAPTQAFVTSVAYNAGLQNGAYRWGDYSMVNVDPADDQTLWTMIEYPGSASQWRIRVIKLLAPPPSHVASMVPNNANPGDTLNVTVNGASAAGSEYYDTDANYTRLVAAFSGAGITVNSVTFSHSNPQQMVLNITIAGNAASGGRDLTVTNPDLQSVTDANVFTVNSTGSLETLAPIGQTIVLGQNAGGNVGSLAADDNNAERICRFIVPDRRTFCQLDLDFTTTKTTVTAVAFKVKAKMSLVGSFGISLYLQDKTNSVFDTVLPEVAGNITSAYQNYVGNGTGAVQRYRGAGGAMTGRIIVRNTGVVVGTGNWCTDFELANLDVTGS